MKLGSHNSMSYMKPQWWMRPFAFMARCQSEDLNKQWKCGVRMFDLRIIFNKNGIPYFAHGLATYRLPGGASNVEYVLNWLSYKASKTKDKVVVRIINERNKDEVKFSDFCNRIDDQYPNLQFCGFRNKNNKGNFNHWKDRTTGISHDGDNGYIDRDGFHSFPTSNQPIINFIDKYSSDNCSNHSHCTGWWIDDIWPWIYAKLHNSKWRNQYQDYDGYLMQDFVGQY